MRHPRTRQRVDEAPPSTLAPLSSRLVSLPNLEEICDSSDICEVPSKDVCFSLEGKQERMLRLFVKNKSGQQRIILDCSGSKLNFKNAPCVCLCTSESLARIEVVLPDHVEPATSEHPDRLAKLAVIGVTDTVFRSHCQDIL